MPAVRLLALLAGLALCTTAVHAQDHGSTGPVRILVTFADPGMSNSARAGPSRPGYSRRSSAYLVSLGVKRAARRLAGDYDLAMVDDWPIVPLKVFCQVYAVADAAGVDALLEELRQRPEVDSAQRLNRFEVSGTPGAGAADPYLELQHNLRTIELGQAHAWSRGEGAHVTIIDTGADLHHPELADRIRTHRDFVGDSRDFIRDAHGTAIAGVIGAAAGNGVGIVGIAPAADVDVLKACWYADGDERAVCDSFTLAKALSHAVESDTDVINLSLGGPPDPLLGRLAGVAIERGIVVVAAASHLPGTGFPADVPGVIVVGHAAGAGHDANVPELNAPGDEILVPVPGGGFDYASGTSLAAAQVSGIVALMAAREFGLAPGDVRRLLVASRSPADRSVNACRALAELLGVSGCRADTATALAR
ncbi:MAG: S8 family serine peptidase [Woeseiaceae bacterium]|nr:S8 family serine peptidase [Woeseiaceae bacterium]